MGNKILTTATKGMGIINDPLPKTKQKLERSYKKVRKVR
jgi:hypothetical protein